MREINMAKYKSNLRRNVNDYQLMKWNVKRREKKVAGECWYGIENKQRAMYIMMKYWNNETQAKRNFYIFVFYK